MYRENLPCVELYMLICSRTMVCVQAETRYSSMMFLISLSLLYFDLIDFKSYLLVFIKKLLNSNIDSKIFWRF